MHIIYTISLIILRYKQMRLQNEQGINFTDLQVFKTFKERHYQGHKKCPTAMTWNCNGNLLVTAENSIKTWHFSEQHGLEKGSQLRGHDTNIDWAQFGTSNILGTLSREAIKIWDVRENGKLSSIRVEKKTKYDFIKFAWNNTSHNDQGLKLAVINKDNSVAIYDYKNMSQPLHTITSKHHSSLQYCGVSWDKTNSVLFLVGGESNSGSISLFNGSSFESLADPIVSHCARITDINFTSNNTKFATVSQDSTVQIHNIPDIICERVFNNKTDSSYKRVSLSCNGKYVAASSDANCIDIFNVEKGGGAWRIKSSVSQQVLSWHPKKMVLAYIDEEDKRRSLDRGDENYIHLFHH